MNNAMKPLRWRSETEFELDGVHFECAVGDYSGRTSDERFTLLKDRVVLEQYASVFACDTPKGILEFGIFQGGSPALFSLWFGCEKFVGIDICQPVTAFDRFCKTHPAGTRIRNYYGTSQTDESRINEIVRAEFGSTPLDAIIDDASHRYIESRRTFEIAFPLLRPGGTYVIEDWGWAHWPHYEIADFHPGQTALSMLIMELIMLCASRGDLISEVRVFPAFAFIRKSPAAKPLDDFTLDGLYLKRNVAVIGAEHLDFKGTAQLIVDRAKQLSKRRLKRTKEKLRRLTRSTRENR